MLKDLCASVLFPTEVTAMLKLKFGGYVRPIRPEPLEELARTMNDIDFCYAVLNKVSRSFAVVIQQLPESLKDPVCIFYLVLRGLDSVEDDMTFPNDKKVPLLRAFHEKLTETGWTIENVGDSADYRVLLKHFDKVIRVFLSLEVKYQHIIADITKRMGHGMADYATKTASIDTVKSYNLYCHYVAGLVGHGLSALFSASGLESPELQKEEELSNNMGLFLQKTNIIRDYVEDLEQGRTWWPEEIWSQYGPTLETFGQKPTDKQSLACLNHMVTDALSLVPDCLEYLARLQDRKIFEFCAIPQVMAMATLELCYNNTKVLSKKSVKIRKGLSCKMMLHSSSLKQVHAWFYAFALRFGSRIPQDDPNAAKARELIAKIYSLTKEEASKQHVVPVPRIFNVIAWVLFLIASAYTLTRLRHRSYDWSDHHNARAGFGNLLDLSAVLTCFTSVGYLFGFFGIGMYN